MLSAFTKSPSEHAAPADQPSRIWNPWLGVGVVIALFVGAQLLAAGLLSIYPLTQHWTSQQTTDWFNNQISATVGYMVATDAILLLGVWGFTRNYKGGLAAIGLRKPRWRDLGSGFAAVIPYYAIYLATVGLATKLIPSLDINQKQELGFNSVHGSTQLALTFVCLVVLPPLVEEILVRGLLYSSLKRAMPVAGAVIGTSLLFAAAHLPEGGAAGPLYVAALDTFVLSLVLIYLREKTGGLWSGMVLHAVKNGVAFTALFALHFQ